MLRKRGSDTRIRRVENSAASEDGQKITFDIVTADGKSHSFWLDAEELERFVPYIIGLSQYAAAASGKFNAPSNSETKRAHPIEAAGVGIAQGRTPDEGVLAIHLGTFSLSFALHTNALQSLHNLLGQALVPAGRRKPN